MPVLLSSLWNSLPAAGWAPCDCRQGIRARIDFWESFFFSPRSAQELVFRYQREQVWGLITSVSKSGTFPILFYLGISWPESGLSSLVANPPLLGKQQQATAAVAWRLVGNVPCRTGGSGLAPWSVLLCRPVPLPLPRQPRLTSGLTPHVPCGFGTAMLVAERRAPNLWAEVWAILPFRGALLEVEVRGILTKSLLPRQIQQTRTEDSCSFWGVGRDALPGHCLHAPCSIPFFFRPEVTLQWQCTRHGRLWMFCSSLFFSNVLVMLNEHLGFCLF